MADLTEKQRAALAAGRNVYSSTNQPQNRGRKPSKLKKWVKEYNVGAADYRAIFNNIIACKTVEELQAMIKKGNVEKLPVVVVACASAVVDDIQHGRLTWTNTVLDRVMSKPTQQVEVEATGGINISNMGMGDRQKRLESLVTKLLEKTDGSVKSKRRRTN
jgi:UDP-N-acetylenolpyruvoylglucosamine reductase